MNTFIYMLSLGNIVAPSIPTLMRSKMARAPCLRLRVLEHQFAHPVYFFGDRFIESRVDTPGAAHSHTGNVVQLTVIPAGSLNFL
jgi:hypothetical protein